MNFERIQLLNIEVNNLSKDALLTSLQKGMVITPNADHLITLQEDREFYNIYSEAEYVVVDSQILFFILKYILRTPVKEKISGSDLLPSFCRHHQANKKMTLFLLGGQPGSAEKALKKVNEECRREFIVGAYSPPFGFENDPIESENIIQRINQSEAKALAVGVGAPKQEKWIHANRHKMPKVDIFLGVGVTIDWMAGQTQRAPQWMQNSGLEWFHRLLKDPIRLSKRYLWRDIPLFWHILKQRFGIYQNPFS